MTHRDGGSRATTPQTVDSVYVHAPFCARRCVYCDFAVTVCREPDHRSWIEALGAELEHVEREGLFQLAASLASLYVGGGTPSLLGPEAMAELGRVVGPARLIRPELEWTAEANPESYSPDLASAWNRAGVNRVSLGAQTFHEPALRWMGRLHGPEGPRRAVRSARAAGVDNISVDLMFGLPPRLGRSWRSDLDAAIALEVEHVSLYGLTVEASTPLGRAVAEGREAVADEAQYEEEYLEAAERLTAAGFEHYEVSNFARPGRRAAHNAVYWQGRPYLGLGPGAHSFAPPIRRWNERDWEAYRARVGGGGGAEVDRELLGAREARLERIWLDLRTSEGLALPPSAAADELCAAWVRGGRATRDEGRVRLTPRGWLVLDRISVDLDAVWEG